MTPDPGKKRERAEQLVRFQASLLEQVRNAVIAIDLDGHIIYWNAFAAALYQWRAKEVLGQSILDVTVPVSERGTFRTILAHTQEYGSWEGECRVRRKDGTTFLAHLTDAVIKDDQGRSVGSVCVSEDITPSERAKAQSQVREEVLHTIFDRVPVMIVFFDEEGRLSFINRCFETAFGWTLEEVRARIMIPEFHPDPAEAHRARELARHPPSGWHSLRLRVKDGSWLDTSWTSVSLKDGMRIGLGVDQTATKRVDQERGDLFHELYASRELLDVLSQRLIEAQEEERRNLSRELHDEIGQVLTTVHLNLEALRSKIDPSAMGRLDDSIKVVNLAIEQIRNISLDLRPASLDLLGLDATLRVYLSRQATRAGLAVEFASNLEGERFAMAIETVCFRVVQEALTNVFRHARASHCWIDLVRSAAGIQLTIRDDGRGFDPPAARERALGGEGFGLLGMFERVQIVGGQMDIDSGPDRGTSIRASFPLPVPAREREGPAGPHAGPKGSAGAAPAPDAPAALGNREQEP